MDSRTEHLPTDDLGDDTTELVLDEAQLDQIIGGATAPEARHRECWLYMDQTA